MLTDAACEVAMTKVEERARLTFGVYVEHLTHFVEAICLFVADDPSIQVSLITETNLDAAPLGSEHVYSFRRLTSDPRILVESIKSRPRAMDWLYLKLSGSSSIRSGSLSAWCKAARRIGCLTDTDYRQGARAMAREVVRSFPYYLRARALISQVSAAARTPYPHVWHKCFFTPTVHPQFLFDDCLRQFLFDHPPPSEGHRPVVFGFIGSRLPPERKTVLRSVRAWLEASDVDIKDEYVGPASFTGQRQKKRALWIEYGDSDPKRGLAPADYIEAMREIDFAICPLGFGGCWTHRVVEAVALGAIPITQDERRYNMGLKDMESCIVVKDGDWQNALSRAAELSAATKSEMRLALRAMREKFIEPRAAAKRVRDAIGLTSSLRR